MVWTSCSFIPRFKLTLAKNTLFWVDVLQGLTLKSPYYSKVGMGKQGWGSGRGGAGTSVYMWSPMVRTVSRGSTRAIVLSSAPKHWLQWLLSPRTWPTKMVNPPPKCSPLPCKQLKTDCLCWTSGNATTGLGRREEGRGKIVIAHGS